MSELALVQDELPVFRGQSYEEHVSTWLEVDRSVQGHYWMLGAVAASMVKRYGDDVAGKFASDVGASRDRIWRYARTYRAWENLQRSNFLSFQHHTIAAKSDNPQKALEVAESEGLSTRELEDLVKTGEIPDRERNPEPQVEEQKTYDAVKEELAGQGLTLVVVPTEPQESEPERDEKEETEEKPRSNMDIHFSSESKEWYTPFSFIEKVIEAMGGIDLDPCADPSRAVPAAEHFTKEDDGLVRDWRGRVYMNPPYGRGDDGIEPFIRKVIHEYESGRVSAVVALVPAKTDTRWFQLLRDFPRCFLRGRLKFSGHENSAPFPSAAFYLGDNEAAFIEAFKDLGDIFRRVEV